MALLTQMNWHNPTDYTHEQLIKNVFIGYHPLFGFMIVVWEVGKGWKDIHRGISVNPQKVAVCTIPEEGDER